MRDLNLSLVNEMTLFYELHEETTLEKRLFSEVSKVIYERGFMNPHEFFEICEWKSTRTKSLVRRNSSERIAEVSRIAFSCSDDLRASVLCLLDGVRIPTASAILSVWNPSKYTVFDVRVCDALPALRHRLLTEDSVRVSTQSYLEYLKLARALAIDLEISLRDLDKTLWTWDKLRT